MENLIETIECGTNTIKIYQDSNCINPRTDYDQGTIILVKPNRYFSGDEDCSFSTEEEVRKHYENSDPVLAILPLYAYIHGGVALSTDSFSCQWDSGQAGWAIITQSKSDEMGFGSFTLEQLHEAIKSEVKEYHHFLNGEVYGYEVSDGEGEILDTCFGYIGDKDGCIDDAKLIQQ